MNSKIPENHPDYFKRKLEVIKSVTEGMKKSKKMSERTCDYKSKHFKRNQKIINNIDKQLELAKLTILEYNIHSSLYTESLLINLFINSMIKYYYYRIINNNSIPVYQDRIGPDNSYNDVKIHIYLNSKFMVHTSFFICRVKIIKEYQDIKTTYKIENFYPDNPNINQDIISKIYNSDRTINLSLIEKIYNKYINQGYICIDHDSVYEIITHIMNKLDSWHGSGLD